MIGTSVSHYEILSQLGSGGMGVVYKARDKKLDRFVALKFLPPHMSADEEAKARFVQEAKAASALDHPNICTVFEIGETDDGKLYIAMPFYDGQTLKYRLQNGLLSVEQAIDITRKLAGGLERAHEAGIVHRDIKPANIMVTDRGEVKILDFGVAKLEEGFGLTTTGSTVGTAAYMSPEQAKGEKADRRSDLWSLGVVFYEMLTGRRPFPGDYQQAVIYGILNDDPKPVVQVNPDVPSQISGAVTRLLSKDPDARFQSATELIRALDSIKGPPPVGLLERRPHFLLNKPTMVGIAVFLIAAIGFLVLSTEEDPGPAAGRAVKVSSLAVLPFSNLRSDPETDFLGFALADQVIGSLSYIQDLKVKPSSLVREYSDGRYDVGVVGDKLNVSYVVAGNYLKEADKIRLTVEMVDVETGTMVWREPIEVEYENAFSLQDLVSRTVLEKLQLTFSNAERARMRSEAPPDPVAYEYYLRALSIDDTEAGNLLAVQMLGQSLRIDSTFASAWSELGSRRRLIARAYTSGTEAEGAEMALLKALEINPDHLDALANLAGLYTDYGRHREAREAAMRILDLNPNSAMGHLSLGYVYRYAGMIEESVREMRTAVSLDSTDIRLRTAGRTFFQAGLYDESDAAFRIGGESAYGISRRAWIRLYQGDRSEAKRLLESLRQLYRNDHLYAMAYDGLGGYLDGDYARGIEAVRRVESGHVADSEVWYDLARTYCLNREAEGCLRTFRKSVETGYVNVPWFEKDMAFDLVRDDQRFQAVLAEARERHEALKREFGNR
ncbi:MAG TPA: protein kinase [Rhodothermia bacterium]|nr:protein kinase [Rhodothermia bacterium]